MVGIGRTVFEGTRVEEFKVHILGVLENVMGPSRNLILARLEGGPLATTGVIAGMSGSPVYIDGRLIGAVSYSLGQFSNEPIAGITPSTRWSTPPRPPLDARPTGAGTARAARHERRRSPRRCSRCSTGRRPFAAVAPTTCGSPALGLEPCRAPSWARCCAQSPRRW